MKEKTMSRIEVLNELAKVTPHAYYRDLVFYPTEALFNLLDWYSELDEEECDPTIFCQVDLPDLGNDLISRVMEDVNRELMKGHSVRLIVPGGGEMFIPAMT